MAGQMEEKKKRGQHQCPPRPETAPWLIFTCGNTWKIQTFCSIVESGESKKYYVKSIPEMRRKRCWSSSHGWLVMVDIEDYYFSLLNPVSLEIMKLPKLILQDDMTVTSCTLSSVPTDPDCLILLFCNTPWIIHCHPGDEHWSKQAIDIPNGNLRYAIGIRDESGRTTIYARTAQAHLAVIDKDPSSGCLSIRMLDVTRPPTPPDTLSTKTYYVESGGELFNVEVCYVGVTCHGIKYIEIHKMDFSELVWVKVKDLGDRVFFLGGGSNLSCNGNPQLGLKSNCIYFTSPKDNHLYVFNLDDEDISCSLPCPELKTPWIGPYWFVPTTNRAVGIRSDCEVRISVDNLKEGHQSRKTMLEEDNENNETQSSILISLPKELQFSIATHVNSAADYMNFRATCKWWLSLAPPIRWSNDLSKSITRAVQSPWFMYFQKDVCYFLDPSSDAVYCMKTPTGLIGARIRCSKHGWLLMSRGSHCIFFYNPFSEAKIELPDMENYHFDCISFSSPPTSSDCVICGICYSDICFYRLGQESWSSITLEFDVKKPFFPSNSSPIFHNGRFYCFAIDGQVGVFKVTNGQGNWEVCSNLERPCSSCHHYYMMECDGDVYAVFIGQNGRSVRCFSLDSCMNSWTRVKSLEDRILYISPTSSLAAITLEKRMQNKIFFPRVCGNTCNVHCVFYSLETGGFHSCFSDSGSKEKKDEWFGNEKLHCTWIQPNLVWTIEGT